MILAVIIIRLCFSQADAWSYSNQGDWPMQCQISATQSPINIDPLQVQYDNSLARSFRCNYINAEESRLRGMVLQTEHSLMLLVDQTTNYTCHGIPFQPSSAAYRLSFLELHWAQTESEHGSEHSIAGEYADTELQMVHFNTKYRSYSEALNRDDGLFVLSIMFSQSEKFDESDNVVGNDAINEIASKRNSSMASVSALDLLHKTGLGPSKPRRFFAYKGSLTSPPCTQGVSWIVAESGAFIELPTLNLLRSLLNRDGTTVGPNIRNQMPGANRNVVASWDHSKQADDHAQLLMLIVSLVGAAIVLVAIGILVWMKFKGTAEYKEMVDSRYDL